MARYERVKLVILFANAGINKTAILQLVKMQTKYDKFLIDNKKKDERWKRLHAI